MGEYTFMKKYIYIYIYTFDNKKFRKKIKVVSFACGLVLLLSLRCNNNSYLLPPLSLSRPHPSPTF